MEPNGIILQGIEAIAAGLEISGVAVIGLAFLFATVRGIAHFGQKKPDAFQKLKIFIGKALQLTLEFLIAADIIRTIIVKPSMDGILSLGLLIVVRTFLSWSIAVEIEGCWPWQVKRKAE